MNLGAFLVSLSVRDLEVSRSFYEKLGFVVSGGNAAENWLILRNGDHVLGLFQGMFDGNVLTFNPGWNQQGEEHGKFDDVRTIQSALKNAGVDLISEADPATAGPGSCMLQDPDGNSILIDQHR